MLIHLCTYLSRNHSRFLNFTLPSALLSFPIRYLYFSLLLHPQTHSLSLQTIYFIALIQSLHILITNMFVSGPLYLFLRTHRYLISACKMLCLPNDSRFWYGRENLTGKFLHTLHYNSYDTYLLLLKKILSTIFLIQTLWI